MCDEYDPTVGCEFPYLNRHNETGCQTTYAEYIGLPYLLYHIFFCFFGVVLFLVALVKNFLIHYYNRYWYDEKTRFRKIFLFVIGLMAFCLFIQGIDPQGYNGTIDPMAEVLFANFCTIMGLMSVISLMVMFAKVLRMIPDPEWLALIWGTIAVVSVILTIIYSVFQVHHNRHLWRGIKLITFAVMLSVTSIVLTWYIRHILKMFSDVWGEDSTVRVIEAKYRVTMYMYLYDLFAIFIVVYQISAGVMSLAASSDKIEPRLTTDQIIFPITQMIGVAFGLCYMKRLNQEYDDWNERTYPPPNASDI